jgi:hypothetical protein
VPQQYGLAQQAPPTAIADGQPVRQRLTRYGDLWVPMPPEAMLAAEGAYFRATNPTPGTALTHAITSAWVATTPTLLIRNTDASSTGKTLYLDYIRLIMTVIPTSSTGWDVAVILDPNNRYASGGTAIALGGNCNTAFSTASIASIFWTPTASAAVAPRLVSRGRAFSVIPVVGSALMIPFAAQDFAVSSTMGGTVATHLYVPCGPIALGPGSNHSALIYCWFPANATTGPSFEVEIGWWER